MTSDEQSTRAVSLPTLLAALLSGISALICEVVWARPLRLLVGDTTLAVALVLAVFFAGMALGSWLIGRRAPRVRDPLRLCALLQLIIALAAAVSVPLLFATGDIHFAALQSLGRGWNLPLGLIESSLILLLPTALMGGTVPLLLQAVAVSERQGQTPQAARFYAWNTLGGAVGAVAAGLWLVPRFGLWQTCLVAAGCNVAAAALLLRTRLSPIPQAYADSPPETSLSKSLLGLLALGAGFTALGYEVLWLRVLSGVITNSAASFALLLGVILIGLALGSRLAARLDFATAWAPLVALQITLGFLVALTALGHAAVLPALVSIRDWFELQGLLGGFLSEGLAAMALAFLPSVLLGLHLPLLFAAWPGATAGAGERWGTLLALNTIGAIVGSLLTAAVLIPHLHVRGTTAVMTATNVALGLALWRSCAPARRLPQAATLVLFLAVTGAVLFPPVRAPLAPGQRLLARTEGLGANVSVTESLSGERALLVNDRYVVGGSGGRMLDYRQALLPALLHPNPRRIFHLGLGTGQTAGALARVPGVERVVTCDNLPDVAAAARDWFGETNLDLFEDPRAEIIIADGRHWLGASSERFDLIVIDNLLPWVTGNSHLMSREHFEMLREHLAPGGLVCVWLPLHQIDAAQRNRIARTLVSVFPDVYVWLARPELETALGLIASEQPLALAHLLDDPRFDSPRLRATLEPALITDAADVLAGLGGIVSPNLAAPLSTDNRPVLEQMALALFHRDLAHHPALFTSPAMGRHWHLLTRERRDSAGRVRQMLGVDADAVSDEQRTAIARLWRRWQNQTTLVAGLLALCRGDERIEDLWLRAAEDDPDDPLPRRMLCWLIAELARDGHWRNAADLSARCRDRFDLTVEARVAWAASLGRTGNHYRARRTLERILEEDPANVNATLELIRVHTLMENHAQARALLEELHRRHPEHPAVAALWAVNQREHTEP